MRHRFLILAFISAVLGNGAAVARVALENISSYNAANYFETISNMILSATYNLLNNAGFRDSLAKQ